MTDVQGVSRHGQLVLADTGVDAALREARAVEMSMYIAQQGQNSSTGPPRGGYMAMPLRAVRMGQGAELFETSRFLSPNGNAGRGVLLALDTGSQGFFIIDSTRNERGQGLLEVAGFGSGKGNYELIVGDPGKPSFTLVCPESWRRFQDAPDLIRRKPEHVPRANSQTIIVGNLWLQAVSVTYDLARMKICMSHLDSSGHRVHAFAGLRELQTPEPMDGKSVEHASAFSEPSIVARRTTTDVTLGLRFMYFPQEGISATAKEGAQQLVAREDKTVTAITLPTLDAIVSLSDGRVVRITQIVDTGSGVNLLLDLDARTSSDCQDGDCYCDGSGRVKDVFAETAFAGSSALSPRSSQTCGQCTEAQAIQKSAGGVCNSVCCLDLGRSCSEEMQCSVVYCTGMLSYSPSFVKLDFPTETGSRHLAGVELFAGKARSVCKPGATLGLWGCWFWDKSLRSQDNTKAIQSPGLPYYLLKHLGQIGGPHENFTLKFWRSDLQKVALPQQEMLGADSKHLQVPPSSASSSPLPGIAISEIANETQFKNPSAASLPSSPGFGSEVSTSSIPFIEAVAHKTPSTVPVQTSHLRSPSYQALESASVSVSGLSSQVSVNSQPERAPLPPSSLVSSTAPPGASASSLSLPAGLSSESPSAFSGASKTRPQEAHVQVTSSASSPPGQPGLQPQIIIIDRTGHELSFSSAASKSTETSVVSTEQVSTIVLIVIAVIAGTVLIILVLGGT